MAKRRKALQRVTEYEGVANLEPPMREDEPYARTRRAAGISGAQHGVAWHRGRHAGLIDAIATLQEWGDVRIANRMLKHYRMDENGTIRF